MEYYEVGNVGVVNGRPDAMLYLTSFVVLQSTIHDYIFVHRKVGKSYIMKEHT